MGELLYAQYSHAGTSIEGTEMILSNSAIRQHTSAAYGGMVVIVCIIPLYVVETIIETIIMAYRKLTIALR